MLEEKTIPLVKSQRTELWRLGSTGLCLHGLPVCRYYWAETGGLLTKHCPDPLGELRATKLIKALTWEIKW